MWSRFDLGISRIGRSIDNEYIEGFWSTLKSEVIKEDYKIEVFEKRSFTFFYWKLLLFFNIKGIKIFMKGCR